jgi:hypothetical protein
MDSYRVERKAVMTIALLDQEAEIAPVPTDAVGHKAELELERLSNILRRFNEQFGTTFTDSDRILRHIRDDFAPKVAADLFKRFVGDMVFAMTNAGERWSLIGFSRWVIATKRIWAFARPPCRASDGHRDSAQRACALVSRKSWCITLST